MGKLWQISMKLPKGHRFLKEDETIEKDDLYFNWNKWVNTRGRYTGRIFKRLNWQPMARKVEIEKIQYTEEDKNLILKKLKKNRAFNGDSAIKIKGDKFPLYYTLAQDKFISIVDEDRFYINKYE